MPHGSRAGSAGRRVGARRSAGERTAHQGEDPRIADHLAAETTRYIGTSAGSTVAAQLASGATLQDLFEAQVEGLANEITVSLDLQ